MGWSNYVLIPSWKMIIETSKEVDELEEYVKKSLDNMIQSDLDTDLSTSDLKISDITIKDLCTLASAYDNASTLAFMNIDKFLLYWLESKDIKYEINSEFNIDLSQYKENGYNIIRRWRSDENNDDNEDNKGDRKEENLREQEE